MKLADLCPLPLPQTDPPLPEEVFVGPGVRDRLAAVVAAHAPGAARVIADPNTWAAAGVALDAPRHLLGRHPHADDDAVAAAEGFGAGADGLVAVGSGTVNDVVKRAAHRLRRPYVVLGTAASMNGYASGIAAILSGGLKTTVPARPPRAIVLDTEILAHAPPALARAGLGDLLSKPVSDTDWWLGDQITGGGYSALPGRLVDLAVAEATSRAAGLPARDLEAHGALATALVLSGVAMVVAGSSSPASGGEHLISHLWDMEALAAGRETRLHGAQVGVASCISAALYQRLLHVRRPALASPPRWSAEAARIRADHGGLAGVVLGPAERKHAGAEARLDRLRDAWSEIRDGLEARALPTPAHLRAPLSAAGAPSTLAALGAARGDGARALRLARDIRERYTVLDLAFELGVLPMETDPILDAAGV